MPNEDPEQIDWKFVLQTWWEGIKLTGAGNAAGLVALFAVFGNKPMAPWQAKAAAFPFALGLAAFVVATYLFTMMVTSRFRAQNDPGPFKRTLEEAADNRLEHLPLVVMFSVLCFTLGGMLTLVAVFPTNR
jgi:hypothetical protein